MIQVGTAVYTALSGPFRGEAGAYTLKQHVNHAVVRQVYNGVYRHCGHTTDGIQMVRRFNTLQLQYILTICP